MSMSKPLSDSLEDFPSIHLDPGDPGSPDPDCSNPKKQPAAAPSNPSLDSGSLIKMATATILGKQLNLKAMITNPNSFKIGSKNGKQDDLPRMDEELNILTGNNDDKQDFNWDKACQDDGIPENSVSEAEKSGNWTLEDNKVREKGMIPDQNQTQSLLIQVPPGPIDCNQTHQDVTLTGSAGQVTFLPENVTNLQPIGKAKDHGHEAQESHNIDQTQGMYGPDPWAFSPTHCGEYDSPKEKGSTRPNQTPELYDPASSKLTVTDMEPSTSTRPNQTPELYGPTSSELTSKENQPQISTRPNAIHEFYSPTPYKTTRTENGQDYSPHSPDITSPNETPEFHDPEPCKTTTTENGPDYSPPSPNNTRPKEIPSFYGPEPSKTTRTEKGPDYSPHSPDQTSPNETPEFYGPEPGKTTRTENGQDYSPQSPDQTSPNEKPEFQVPESYKTTRTENEANYSPHSPNNTRPKEIPDFYSPEPYKTTRNADEADHSPDGPETTRMDQAPECHDQNLPEKTTMENDDIYNPELTRPNHTSDLKAFNKHDESTEMEQDTFYSNEKGNSESSIWGSESNQNERNVKDYPMGKRNSKLDQTNDKEDFSQMNFADDSVPVKRLKSAPIEIPARKSTNPWDVDIGTEVQALTDDYISMNSHNDRIIASLKEAADILAGSGESTEYNNGKEKPQLTSWSDPLFRINNEKEGLWMRRPRSMDYNTNLVRKEEEDDQRDPKQMKCFSSFAKNLQFELETIAEVDERKPKLKIRKQEDEPKWDSFLDNFESVKAKKKLTPDTFLNFIIWNTCKSICEMKKGHPLGGKVYLLDDTKITLESQVAVLMNGLNKILEAKDKLEDFMIIYYNKKEGEEKADLATKAMTAIECMLEAKDTLWDKLLEVEQRVENLPQSGATEAMEKELTSLARRQHLYNALKSCLANAYDTNGRYLPDELESRPALVFQTIFFCSLMPKLADEIDNLKAAIDVFDRKPLQLGETRLDRNLSNARSAFYDLLSRKENLDKKDFDYRKASITKLIDKFSVQVKKREWTRNMLDGVGSRKKDTENKETFLEECERLERQKDNSERPNRNKYEEFKHKILLMLQELLDKSYQGEIQSARARTESGRKALYSETTSIIKDVFKSGLEKFQDGFWTDKELDDFKFTLAMKNFKVHETIRLKQTGGISTDDDKLVDIFAHTMEEFSILETNQAADTVKKDVLQQVDGSAELSDSSESDSDDSNSDRKWNKLPTFNFSDSDDQAAKADGTESTTSSQSRLDAEVEVSETETQSSGQRDNEGMVFETQEAVNTQDKLETKEDESSGTNQDEDVNTSEIPTAENISQKLDEGKDEEVKSPLITESDDLMKFLLKESENDDVFLESNTSSTELDLKATQSNETTEKQEEAMFDHESKRKYAIISNQEQHKILTTKVPPKIPLIKHEKFTRYRSERQASESSSEKAGQDYLDYDDYVHHLEEKFCRVIDARMSLEILSIFKESMKYEEIKQETDKKVMTLTRNQQTYIKVEEEIYERVPSEPKNLESITYEGGPVQTEQEYQTIMQIRQDKCKNDKDLNARFTKLSLEDKSRNISNSENDKIESYLEDTLRFRNSEYEGSVPARTSSIDISSNDRSSSSCSDDGRQAAFVAELNALSTNELEKLEEKVGYLKLSDFTHLREKYETRNLSLASLRHQLASYKDKFNAETKKPKADQDTEVLQHYRLLETEIKTLNTHLEEIEDKIKKMVDTPSPFAIQNIKMPKLGNEDTYNHKKLDCVPYSDEKTSVREVRGPSFP